MGAGLRHLLRNALCEDGLGCGKGEGHVYDPIDKRNHTGASVRCGCRTGSVLLFGVTALISAIGLFELYRVLGIERKSLAAVGYATACSYYGILWFEGQKYITLMIIASLMVMMALYVLHFQSIRQKK